MKYSFLSSRKNSLPAVRNIDGLNASADVSPRERPRSFESVFFSDVKWSLTPAWMPNMPGPMYNSPLNLKI